MALSTQKKQSVVKEFQASANDTGSSEVQVALLTKSIEELSAHMQTHKKDVHSRRGLIQKVNQRRSLLKYLKKTSLTRYNTLIAKLGLRK
jgi:small subunit ribosomal protein S15